MPSSCCVPLCRGNYPNSPKVNVFKFPSDKDLRDKWTNGIKRENFKPTKSSRNQFDPHGPYGDIIVWGHVKTIVYTTKPSSLEDLKAKITNVISGITINHLANVFHELQKRILLCIANHGGHVET